jgi:hypothetical protein
MATTNPEIDTLQAKKHELIRRLMQEPYNMDLLPQIASFEATIRSRTRALLESIEPKQKAVLVKAIKREPYQRGEKKRVYKALLEDYREAKRLMQACSDLKKALRENTQ